MFAAFFVPFVFPPPVEVNANGKLQNTAKEEKASPKEDLSVLIEKYNALALKTKHRERLISELDNLKAWEQADPKSQASLTIAGESKFHTTNTNLIILVVDALRKIYADKITQLENELLTA